jgi:hypothetical protein
VSIDSQQARCRVDEAPVVRTAPWRALYDELCLSDPTMTFSHDLQDISAMVSACA